MSKIVRQNKILQLIAQKDIDTQAMLTEELIKQGFNVTQATVSRDISELSLIKVTTKDKQVRYERALDPSVAKLKALFHQSAISMDGVKNFIVIKTISGGASSACVVIDKLDIPVILGTIAGDDTVLVILKDENMLDNVIKELQALMD